MVEAKTFYKGTRAGGLSFHNAPNGKPVRYVVGKTVSVPKARRGMELCSEGVLHACEEPNQLLRWCFPEEVYVVEGAPVADDGSKVGAHLLLTVALIPEDELNVLFGWDYLGALRPVNPLLMCPTVTEEDEALLRKWVQVWAQVWAQVRVQVGVQVWVQVRDQVGDQIGAYVGDLFHSDTHPWVHHDLAQLWRRGLVATFINGKAQLRGGPEMKVLYEEDAP